MYIDLHHKHIGEKNKIIIIMDKEQLMGHFIGRKISIEAIETKIMISFWKDWVALKRAVGLLKA